MTEEQLINECKAGKALAQRQLYEKYSRKMMGICMRYTSNRDEAQDILQDGFVKVFDKLNTYQGQGSFEGWLRRIFVNTALDQYRKNKQTKGELDIDDVGYAIDSGVDVASNIQADELLRILQKIPAGYRIVFNMYAIEGFSHKEIAEELGVSENTSKTQFMRARAFLKNILEKQKMI